MAHKHVIFVPREPQAPWLLLLPTTVRVHLLAGKAPMEVPVCVLRDITAKIALHAWKIHTAWVAQQLFKLHAQTTQSPQPAVIAWMIANVTLVSLPTAPRQRPLSLHCPVKANCVLLTVAPKTHIQIFAAAWKFITTHNGEQFATQLFGDKQMQM